MKRIDLLANWGVFLILVSLLGSCGKSAVDMPSTEKVAAEEVSPSQDKKDENPTEEAPLPKDKEEIVTPPTEQGINDKKDNTVPEQYDVITRLSVRWKSDSDYQTKFDYHRLTYLKDEQFIAPEYLSQFITFYVIPVSGTTEYVLNAQDIQKLGITKIQTNGTGNSIEILYSYNGQASSQKLSLAFDKTKYYAGQINQNSEAIRSLYSAGVARHIDLYVNRILSYDTSRYIVLSDGSATLQSDGEVAINVKILPKGSDEFPLATANILVKGFKPIAELSKEIYAELSDNSFNEYIQKHARQKEYLEATISQKMTKLVRYYIKRGDHRIELYYSANQLAPGGEGAYLDVFLDNPKFAFKSITEESDAYDVVVTLMAGSPYFTHDFHIHVPKKIQ